MHGFAVGVSRFWRARTSYSSSYSDDESCVTGWWCLPSEEKQLVGPITRAITPSPLIDALLDTTSKDKKKTLFLFGNPTRSFFITSILSCCVANFLVVHSLTAE